MPPKLKNLSPISRQKVKDANVIALIDHLKRIAEDRIFLCRWNFDYAYTNAPVGLGVKLNDVEAVKKVLGSITGTCITAKDHVQFDLSRFSKILGTHLNVFKSGRLELQGAQVGDGKYKRFPVNTTFVLGGFLDLVSQIYEGLTAEKPQNNQATTPKRIASNSSIFSNANPEDDHLNEEFDSFSATSLSVEEPLQTLPEEKRLLEMFHQIDKKKRHEIAAKILELDEHPLLVEATPCPPAASSPQITEKNQANTCPPSAKPLSVPRGGKTAAEAVASSKTIPAENVTDNEAQYKILPIFLANSFPTNIKNDPKQLSITVKSLQPNAEFEVQVLKSGDIKIMAKSPRDYAVLKQPWPVHPEFGIVSPKLPHQNTVNQSILILGLSKTISEDEIKNALKEINLFPKDVQRFSNAVSQTPPVKVILDSKEEKDRITQAKFHIYHQRFNVVSFEEDPLVSQCHKCLLFGHHARICNAEQRCNRCGGSHRHTDCQVNRDEAKCCNCGGAHAASFKGCAKYKTAVAAEKEKLKENRKTNHTALPQSSASSNVEVKTSLPVLLASMAEIMASFVSSLKALMPQSDLNPQIPYNIVSNVAKTHLKINISPNELHQMAETVSTSSANFNQNRPLIPDANLPSTQATLSS